MSEINISNETNVAKTKSKDFTEVWGDTVYINELFYSAVIGIVFTMTFYLIGSKIFLSIESIEPSLAKGYSLLIGITGCIISAFISAKLFKPKRVIEEKFEIENIEEVIKAAGMTLEDEIEALSNLDKQLIEEMEELELWALLALIPKDSQNYKPLYREKLEERGN